MKTKNSREHVRSIDTRSNSGVSTEPLWTIEDVSSYLRLKPETVRLMARQSKIPSIKIGRVWRFRSLEIKSWLQLQGASEEQPGAASTDKLHL
jgi:excisionase family DNA binding protein